MSNKKLKVIIAGPRDFYDTKEISNAIRQGCKALKIEIKELVHGNANGVDKIAGQWAQSQGIPVKVFPAEWSKITDPTKVKYNFDKYKNQNVPYNPMAGFERNEQMAQYADALIAIDLGTNGTKDMIERARKHNLLVYIHSPDLETHDFKF